MDIDKFINENLDEIIDNSSDFIIDKKDNKSINIREIYKELDEEEYNEDYVGELFQDMYLKSEKQIKNSKKKQDREEKYAENKEENEEKYNDDSKEDNEDEIREDDEGIYYINLMNIFMKHYNNKYDKKKHFFSDIKDVTKDTSNQMELFFEAIVEYKMIKEKNNYNDEEMMKYYFTDKDKIKNLLKEHKGQIYSLEIKYKKYISCSLLVLLNFIHEKNILEEEWNIYNLRNFE